MRVMRAADTLRTSMPPRIDPRPTADPEESFEVFSRQQHIASYGGH